MKEQSAQIRPKKKAWEIIVNIFVPLALAVALGIVCWWGAAQSARAESLLGSAQERVRQTYYELADNINDMQLALKKLTVVNSPRQYALLLSDVWRSSGAAVSNMATLPASHPDNAAVNRFVVQAGDYARQLESRILAGEIISAQDQKQLAALYQASVQVAGRLNDQIQRGDLAVDALDTEGYYGIASQGDAAQAGENPSQGEAAQAGEEDTGGSAGESQSKDSDSVSDYPTLIYDGPFSESTEKAEPRGLGEGQCDIDTARRNALSYMRGGVLTDAGEQGGVMAAYLFTGTDGEGRSVEIAVTKTGGQVLWMMTPVQGAEEGVPDKEVSQGYRQSAQEYLDARGYEGMEATYAQYYAGTAVLNFASTKDNVILYGDLVKVYIERASSRVCGIDANNYLFSHGERTLQAPALTQEEAQDRVSEALQIQSVRLALIPKTPNVEILCYEFKGSCGGTSFIVYVNALTGAEEEVYEIINSDEGELVV